MERWIKGSKIKLPKLLFWHSWLVIDKGRGDVRKFGEIARAIGIKYGDITLAISTSRTVGQSSVSNSCHQRPWFTVKGTKPEICPGYMGTWFLYIQFAEYGTRVFPDVSPSTRSRSDWN